MLFLVCCLLVLIIQNLKFKIVEEVGKILQQSIKGTIYSYIGVGLGFVTSALIMPHVFSTEQIGVFSLLLSYSIIFMQFATLGFNSVTSRFFTYFRSQENNHHGYLFLVVSAGLLGCIVFLALFFLGKPWLIELSREKSAMFIDYIYLLLPLTFFTVFFFLFDAFYTVLYNSTFGTFLRELVMRILILIVIGVYAIKLVNYNEVVLLYVSALCLPTLFMVGLLIKQGYFNLKPNLGFISKEMRQSMFHMAAFGFVFGMGGILIQYLNNIMIGSMLGLAFTGIFTISYYLGNIVIIPARPLTKIANTIIADAWKENDIANIKDVYYKSCLNQYIVGIAIFILVFLNLDYLLSFLPDDYLIGRNVIILIGLANVINMVTGLNIAIIFTSKYYKVLGYFISIQILVTIISNYFCIKYWGISGAALAYLLSNLTLNSMCYFYLLYKYQFQPFNKNDLLAYLKYSLIMLSVSVFLYFLPPIEILILGVIIKTLVVLGAVWFAIVHLKVSSELLSILNKITQKK